MAAKTALVRLAANQTIANGTETTVVWASAVHDGGSFWSAGTPDRLTVPTGVSEVVLTAYAAFETSTSGDYWIRIYHGTGTLHAEGMIRFSTVADNERVFAQTPIIKVTPGDHFYTTVWQGSGASQDLLDANTTFFAIEAYESTGQPPHRRPILSASADADALSGHIDAFRIAHVQRSDG